MPLHFSSDLKPNLNNTVAICAELQLNWPRTGVQTECFGGSRPCWPVDQDSSLVISGNGDVIEPDDGILAIGSGGPQALAAARALARNTDLSARQIAEAAMEITAEICVYTNNHFVFEELAQGNDGTNST